MGAILIAEGGFSTLLLPTFRKGGRVAEYVAEDPADWTELNRTPREAGRVRTCGTTIDCK